MLNSLLKPIANYLPENNRLERIWKLAQVDFKKRYYNDKLGLLWALLNPLFRIGVYYVVFTHVLDYTRVENYGVFLFAGLLLWMAFSECTNGALSLIRKKKYLIENIQFNQIDLFLSHTLSVFLGLLFNLGAFLIICLLTGETFTWTILWLPLILANLFIICMGTSMILATIQIYLKDIVHAWSIVVLAGFWTSGVLYRGDDIIKFFPPIKILHPFVGLITNLRNITMSETQPDFELALLNIAFGIVVLLLGLFLFKRYSHKAIELI